MRGHGEGVYVTEREVLEQFLKPDERMMLVPIIGGSGTGKSHLVRWIGAQLGKSNDRRRIVYVPKHGTSLRKVIELILDEMEGQDVAELRDALQSATSKLDERAAPSAVLGALADAVEFRDQRRVDSEEEEERRSALREVLPDLLRDPLFRNNYFLVEGGIVRTFVDRALRGHRPGDKEEAFEFTAQGMQDLTRINSEDASATAKKAKQLLTLASNAKSAAQLLTENLGAAIQSVFGLEGSVSLSDVMMQTRAVLAERGSELVLLIEDFTMLQGIQRELLDAIVEPPDRSGSAPLCGIRVTLAVTAGYWDTLADTVRTRAAFASHIYDLNVPIDENDEGPSKGLPSMVARYLNAARLGRKTLDELYTGDLGEDWVPNACDDCVFRNECHEAFGEVDGRGLYPFNLTALWRTSRAVLDDDYIDPRAILGSVVKFTLEQHHSDIRDGHFPPVEYEVAFDNPAHSQRRLPADVIYELKKFPDPDRRKVLLTIWADAPPMLQDLAPGIHKAFQIPMTDIVTTESDPEVIERDTPWTPDVTPSARRSDELIDREIQQVRDWAAGVGVLPEGLTRSLRQHLVDGLWNSIDWDSELLKRDSSDRDRILSQASFVIADAAGGRAPSKDMWKQEIPRSDEAALLFTGIITRRSAGNWAFPGGPAALRIRLNLFDKWRNGFLEHLRRVSGLEATADQETLIRDLVMDSCVLGSSAAATNNLTDVLAAAFEPDDSFPLEAVLKRRDRLSSVAKVARDRRSEIQNLLLRNLGARQGGGGVQAVDTTALLPVVQALLHDSSALLDDKTAEAMRVEIADVRGLGVRIFAHLGAESDTRKVAATVRAAIDTAVEISAFYPNSEAPMLRSLAQDYADFDLGILGPAMEEGSPLERDPRATLVWLAQDPGSELKAYLGYLDGVSRQLQDCIFRAKRGQASMGLSEALEVLKSEMIRVRDALDLGV